MDASAALGAAREALAHGVIAVDIPGRSFGGTPVLGPIRFRVRPGETVAILGPSGIGKSTLLRIAAGIDRIAEGRAERPGRMAMVMQEPTLLPWRSAIDNLTVVHPALTPHEAMAMLERVGLGAVPHHFPGQLSLGQQRRLALARAFAGGPEGLVMDEPFVSLDPETAERMLALTERLIADARPAALLVTHSAAEAERLADRVLRLSGHPATLSGALGVDLAHGDGSDG